MSVRKGAFAQGADLYVKADAVGANSGTSWENAVTDLQSPKQQPDSGTALPSSPTERASRLLPSNTPRSSGSWRTSCRNKWRAYVSRQERKGRMVA